VSDTVEKTAGSLQAIWALSRGAFFRYHYIVFADASDGNGSPCRC
jgi:hypothetical protein